MPFKSNSLHFSDNQGSENQGWSDQTWNLVPSNKIPQSSFNHCGRPCCLLKKTDPSRLLGTEHPWLSFLAHNLLANTSEHIAAAPFSRKSYRLPAYLSGIILYKLDFAGLICSEALPIESCCNTLTQYSKDILLCLRLSKVDLVPLIDQLLFFCIPLDSFELLLQ